MADFFSRLVERSLGVSPVVQPAIAPRFSSAPAIVDEVNLQWHREAENSSTPVNANPSVEVPSSQNITSVQQQFSPQPDLANNQVPGKVQQNPITTPSLLTQSIHSSNLKQVIPPMTQVIAPSQFIAEQPNQEVSLEPFQVLKPRESHPPTTQAIAPSQFIAEQPNQEVSLEPFRVLKPREQILGENPSPVMDGELANAPEIVAHRATVPISKPSGTIATHQVSQVASEPAAPPTIRVSIGRVEVRAIMPTPPAPKAAPVRSRPAVSLDTYLQQRGRKA
ncbi:hypothetical protein [Nostoc parmelioides]|uniref:Uncharacterized protein n=1 Tax=Nostoc parmelioides FACHB-3921 TaxID=2692909 RepID=A0ABR8BGY6_9NOSO|nr:hypothetical protein [Nostoc parmelioides]MBD2253362.1 hypothetical protein [Nostoc parmelioides FACHB-3921]